MSIAIWTCHVYAGFDSPLVILGEPSHVWPTSHDLAGQEKVLVAMPQRGSQSSFCPSICYSVGANKKHHFRFPEAIQHPIISNHIQSYPIISNLTLFHMAFLWQKSHHFREAMGDDFTRAQLATYARVVPDMDVIITTAMIPNRSAPELITAEMVVPHLISLLFVDRNG